MTVKDFRTAQNDIQTIEIQRLHAAFQMAAEFGDDDVVDQQIRHGEITVNTPFLQIFAIRIDVQTNERFIAQPINAV